MSNDQRLPIHDRSRCRTGVLHDPPEEHRDNLEPVTLTIRTGDMNLQTIWNLRGIDLKVEEQAERQLARYESLQDRLQDEADNAPEPEECDQCGMELGRNEGPVCVACRNRGWR